VVSWSVKRLQPGWVAIAPMGATAQAVHLVWPAGERPALRWACSADWTDATTGLRQLRRQQALQQHRCVGLLQRHQYQLLPMDAPDVPRPDWRDAVRWRLKEMVDFPVEDAGIDLLEIPAEHSQRGRTGLLAAVASRRELETLAQAGDSARTPWQAIDLPDTALRNLCALTEEAGRGQALLSLGSTHSGLVITAQGELLLSRQIDITLTQLGESDADTRQAAWDRAALELQRTLDNFERQFNRVGISRLLVSPAAPDGFVAYLRELIYLPVQVYALDQAVDLSAVPLLADPAEQARYFCAIGAALRTD
jgi:MSHA biogenesis protein MshI